MICSGGLHSRCSRYEENIVATSNAPNVRNELMARKRIVNPTITSVSTTVDGNPLKTALCATAGIT